LHLFQIKFRLEDKHKKVHLFQTKNPKQTKYTTIYIMVALLWINSLYCPNGV
jgi:hypothetical protein